MKTPEEWLTDPANKARKTEADVVEWIATIQHDAQRSAYTQCAEIVTSNPITSTERTAQAIITARDNLKQP